MCTSVSLCPVPVSYRLPPQSSSLPPVFEWCSGAHFATPHAGCWSPPVAIAVCMLLPRHVTAGCTPPGAFPGQQWDIQSLSPLKRPVTQPAQTSRHSVHSNVQSLSPLKPPVTQSTQTSSHSVHSKWKPLALMKTTLPMRNHRCARPLFSFFIKSSLYNSISKVFTKEH